MGLLRKTFSVAAPTDVMEPTASTRKRAQRGTPGPGQFVAEHAPESAVGLHPPVDNGPAAVAARQLERRQAFAREHAGERCPSSGKAASVNWDSGMKLVPVKAGSGFLRGTMLCLRCGNAGALVQRVWSGPKHRSNFTWTWMDHPVPRT
jgi:hypothetical protein